MKNRVRQTPLPGFEAEETSSPETPDAGGPIPAAIQAPVAKLPDATAPDAASTVPSPGQTVWVIDAHSLIHQVFHAMPDMTGPSGEPVGAVFGFTRDLFYLLEEKRPDYLFCAFDLPGKTFRHVLCESYKQHRPAMPDALVPQISAIRRVLAALGVPAIGCESYEADDILATIARQAEGFGIFCFLVTADKDCRQLITDHVKVYNIRKNDVFDEARVLAEWGIAPSQVVDFQALVGDAVDNVPGVPLIGPKLAKQLLEQYGTLEAVLNHADEAPGAKRRENLKRFREQALLSRTLVQLDAHVPLTIDWPAGRTGRIDREATLSLFREFGFRSLERKL